MKVLTLHQPWASLVALGVKTIETRSWSTSYRGPLAIHAGSRRPAVHHHWNLNDALPPAIDLVAMSSYWEWTEHQDFGHGGDYRWSGPLGAIVATCTLTDVIPMVHSGGEGAIRTLDIDPNGSLWIVEPEPDEDDDEYPRQDWRDVTDQLPYGDYRPGRFAWLLADITPLAEPVPFKGGQGLTREWAGTGSDQ